MLAERLPVSGSKLDSDRISAHVQGEKRHA